MRICFVSVFPPSARMLNEYAYHVVRELQAVPALSVTVLADVLEDPVQPELPGFDVLRRWGFNKLSNPARILKSIRQIQPDVVWFNLLFATFGNQLRPAAAFCGLLTPALVRLSGYYTHVTLHHLMDHVNLDDAQVRSRKLYRLAGWMATKTLLLANSSSVLLPAYRRTLLQKYNGKDVHFTPHGIFSACPEPPDFSQRGNPEHRILAFGHWGTYKRLELLLEAFPLIAAAVPNVRLVIAGCDHPIAPGYLQSVADRCRENKQIEFAGYVPEAKLPELFGTSSFLVMPYSSSTGSSGVAHQACEYGLPIVCTDIPDFREMSEYEGLATIFYRPGNAGELAESCITLLRSPGLMREMAEQNYSAALRMTFPTVMKRYLRVFDIQRSNRRLQAVSRFRDVPRWLPFRSALFPRKGR